ncbi:MAG: hypothetical protein IPP07_13695 [Holophagales bacterium]|nr:hypothetical protein [Holophagales bacterium]
MPGARNASVTWRDGSGKLWLFGGYGYSAGDSGWLNDLWRFDPVPGQWTWMSGSSDADQVGTYGSLGTPAPGNVPGARSSSVSWTDASGNLWLFGGGTYLASASSYVRFNDLWKFDPGLGQWTWMSGSIVPDRWGTYGSLGTPAAGNAPGARSASVSWTDGSGKLWLFGGIGFAAASQGRLNDPLEIRPGDRVDLGRRVERAGRCRHVRNARGARGGERPRGTVRIRRMDGRERETLALRGEGRGAERRSRTERPLEVRPCARAMELDERLASLLAARKRTGRSTPAPGNTPGHERRRLWTDGSGRLWLFGGLGCGAEALNLGRLNDLWRFDPGSGQWTWMGGSDALYQGGTYGSLGTPAPGNVPGARTYSAMWTDGSGSFWLFGGESDGPSPSGNVNDLWKYDPAIGQWAWMGGPNDPYRYGTYGSLGTPAPGNVPGGRGLAVSWTDGSGSLWLFGGWGYASSSSGYLNDLWKYDRGIGQWSWRSGSDAPDGWGTSGSLGTPAPGNVPGARTGSVSWTDGSGNLWLFGGERVQCGGGFCDSFRFNDLWKYDPGIGQWTWMSGSNLSNSAGTYGTLGTPAPGNVPGGRSGSVSWTDGSGKFWLFGGDGYSESGFGSLNDLWKYDPGIGQWTWMGGSNAPDQSGTYGTLGTPAPGNVPGARFDAVSWTDGVGKLWLFGGLFDSPGGYGHLNDLWKYDPGIGQWSWMGGSDSIDQLGVYGTLGTPAPGNTPGARESSVSWTDGNGKLWLFGGAGRSAGDQGVLKVLNDLWRFDPAIGQWAWMGGSNAPNQSGSYGTLGTPSAGNVPGARYDSVSWTDGGEKLWLFGGWGFGPTPLSGGLSDLWSYSVCAPISAPVAGSAARCGAGSLTITASGAGPGQDYRWYDAATGGTLLQSNGSTFTTGTISATTTYFASVYDPTTSCESDRTAVTAMVLSSPLAPTASNDGPVCDGATLRLSSPVIPGATYSWTGPNGFTSAEASPSISN